MPHLWCAGQLEVTGLGKCNRHTADFNRLKFSCLTCRLRRYVAGSYTLPPFYIKYVFSSIYWLYIVKTYEDKNGNVLQAPTGKVFHVARFYHLLVDPRGHYTHLRLSAIRCIDRFLAFYKSTFKLKSNKPWIEFAEFLANYP